METVGEGMAQSRAGTDESLGAERAITDTSLAKGSITRRRLDDLIERDRISADQRLLKFRQSADSGLARGRSVSAPEASSVNQERREADQHTRAERKDADALVEQERERADAAIDSERRGHRTEHAELEARRQDTNAQLVAERKRADLAVAALSDTRVAAAHADGEPGRDILAVVTHELRNPLSIISLNAQHIAEIAQDPTIREAADDVTRASARMERLLMDLLDVARIDSGILRMVKRPHDIGALVAQILHSYQPLFEARGMTFTTHGPAKGLLVSFDHDRLVQVISNLLGNAMKFSSPSGTVSLDVERQAEGITFVVRDDGPGIEPADLGHVFEKFWKIDSQARRGLGLGLHICRSIVTGHGGRMWVESDLGHGAAFFFTLPTG